MSQIKNPAEVSVYQKILIIILIFFGFSSCSIRNKQEYYNEIQNWQKNRLERLKSETGWLNLVGLFWLHEGTNTAGSDSSNTLIFPENAPGYCGKFILHNEKVVYFAPPELHVSVNGTVIDSTIMLPDTTHTPTICKTGSFVWHVIKRPEGLAIRLRDYASPGINKIDHIPCYEINVSWKKYAEFIEFDSMGKIEVPTMTGGIQEYNVPGKLVFRHKLKKYELLPFQTESGFFIILGDLTSAKETYAAGRFLYCAKPDSKNKVVLDFNKTYNPPCAFSPFATCPLPPPENRLKLAITAGEKNVHIH